MQHAEQLMERMTELLGAHEDYSLLITLHRLRAVAQTNPRFEAVLKNNAECDYCRSYIYENAKCLYLPEMRCLFAAVEKAYAEGGEIDRAAVLKTTADIRQAFLETPLEGCAASERSLAEILSDAARDIAALSFPAC